MKAESRKFEEKENLVVQHSNINIDNNNGNYYNDNHEKKNTNNKNNDFKISAFPAVQIKKISEEFLYLFVLRRLFFFILTFQFLFRFSHLLHYQARTSFRQKKAEQEYIPPNE